MAVCKGRVFFLNMTTIRKQDSAKITGAWGRMYLALEALAVQQGQIATMVQVGVGEDDGIHVLWRHWQVIPVSQAQIFEALKQATVDQQFLTVMLD